MTKGSTLLIAGNSVYEAENNETCDRGLEFRLDSSDESTLSITKWIPYPEPGQ